MQLTNIIQLVAILAAASILGNWYLSEFKKARAARLPFYRAYFSLPGVLIILLILMLPILARYVQK